MDWTAPSLAKARLLALLAPALLLGGAYGSQYLGGLFPCEMCWWQRYAHFAALALAILAYATARQPVSRLLVLLAALASLASGLIGAFHAGVEYHWWEGLSLRCTNNSGLSGSHGDMLRELMATPLIRCDAAQWSLWGISLAGWNALFSCDAAIGILWLLRKPSL